MANLHPCPTLVQTSVYNETMETLKNYVFVGTNGKIRALEIKGNEIKSVWKETITEKCMVHLNLFAERGHLYAAANGTIYCFKALTGATVWQEEPKVVQGKSDLITSIISRDGSILVSATNAGVAALTAETGATIWSKKIDREFGSEDTYSLLERNGLLFIGNEGHVYAYNIKDGQTIWKNGLRGMGYGPVTLAACSHSLFVGTQGYIIALDAQTGGKRHKVNLKGTGYNPVAMLVDPNTATLFVATSGEMDCFQIESMKKLWKSKLPGMGYTVGHSLLLLDDQTIAIGMEGKVATVNKSSGKIIWKASLSGSLYDMVTLAPMADPNVLICASFGKVYGIQKHNGKKIWKDSLPSMGHSEICVSTTIFNTDFNSTTLPHSKKKEREIRKPFEDELNDTVDDGIDSVFAL